MEEHNSALALILASKPDLPVHCLRPHAAKKAASWFMREFPGDVLYAVKANTHPLILDAVYEAGVRKFDVASMPEIELLHSRFPDATLAFLHPVKARSSIRRAYYEFGIRIFAIDTLEELAKIQEETNNAHDLQIIVRLAVSSDYAQHKLSGKFGAIEIDAVDLLPKARAVASKLGVSFHVGSQCMRPEAWRVAMKSVSNFIRQAGVPVDIIDVGGGFPSVYPGVIPPPLISYIHEIKAAFADMPVLENADLWCEPGRALCAEAGSHVLRVDLRKGDKLYLNDGAYGALYDAAHGDLIFPTQMLRPAKESKHPLQAFTLFGPTCDAIDVMHSPFHLPANISESDYIEFGSTGAYGAELVTKFNGFGNYLEVVLFDAPMLSMYTGDRSTDSRNSILEREQPA